MRRERKTGMRIDGLLIVDKPEGITSLEVVREVKRRFHVKKAGHIGTLDPFATGVLPVAMNEGTKLVPFLEEEPKEYVGTLKLGEETKTDDPTGEVIFRESLEGVTPEVIHAAFGAFSGRILQTPPMFSAVKVAGRPLYRLARQGIEIERKEREVRILDLQIETIELPWVSFRVACSKGTYVRTLARDIGMKIGCRAHLFRLRRVRSGPYTLEKAISLDQLKGFLRVEELQPWLISLEDALPGIPEWIGDERLVKKVRFGNEMTVGDLGLEPFPALERGQWVKITSPRDGLVAILKSEIKGEDLRQADPEAIAFRPLRVFHPKKDFRQENSA